jgi:LPXTG-motif cell wall-anchored protein
MLNPFQLIAQRMVELGAINFFIPWIITTTIFWALLTKSKMFESSLVNAILSISVAFLVWGYLVSPIAIGLGKSLSIFITQGLVLIIVFMVALLGASMFYPKFGETLTTAFKSKTMIWIFIAIFFGGLFFTSGLYRVLINGLPSTGKQSDVLTLIIMLVALIIGMLILVGVKSSMEGEK